MYKKYFITFGGGSKNYIDAAERLCKQAKSSRYFDICKYFTDKDLKSDSTFWKKHSNFILNNKRGFGYWLWKPYLISKIMKTINDGDILLYLDCGCEIGINSHNLPKYFEYVKKYKIITSLFPYDEGYKIINYTKKDILVYFNLQDDKEFLNHKQIEAGCIMFFACKKVRNFLDEWYNICQQNYNLIDDSKSKSNEFIEFKENRHDQSIFASLFWKYNFSNKKDIKNCVIYFRLNKKYISVVNIYRLYIITLTFLLFLIFYEYISKKLF